MQPNKNPFKSRQQDDGVHVKANGRPGRDDAKQ